MYDKHTGCLIGYTDLGEVNNHLLAFEHSLDEPAKPAKSMLTFMVKGLFTNLKFSVRAIFLHKVDRRLFVSTFLGSGQKNRNNRSEGMIKVKIKL